MARYLVVCQSLSGNTESFVRYLERTYGGQFVIITPKEFEKNVYYTTETWDAVFIGCFTWDEGKIPVQMKRAAIAHRIWLNHQKLFVFGSGWTMYEHFCRAVDSLQIIVGRECPHIKFELNYQMRQNRECDDIVEKFMLSVGGKRREIY